jgi:hypothetical protein
MTGFKSKRAAAQDKLDDDDTQVYGDALLIAYQSGYYDGKKAAQPAQEFDVLAPHPKPTQAQLAYLPPTPDFYAPPQRTWVDLTGNEWFEWWRVSQLADETEAEIEFSDFITIALAVTAKLKEENT